MHLRKTLRVAWLFGLAALLTACSSIPLKDREIAERALLES